MKLSVDFLLSEADIVGALLHQLACVNMQMREQAIGSWQAFPADVETVIKAELLVRGASGLQVIPVCVLHHKGAVEGVVKSYLAWKEEQLAGGSDA